MTKGRHGDLAPGPPSLPPPLILTRSVMADHAASSPHFCFIKSQEVGESLSSSIAAFLKQNFSIACLKLLNYLL